MILFSPLFFRPVKRLFPSTLLIVYNLPDFPPEKSCNVKKASVKTLGLVYKVFIKKTRNFSWARRGAVKILITTNLVSSFPQCFSMPYSFLSHFLINYRPISKSYKKGL